MGAATDVKRGALLDQAQKQQVVDYLRSPGSGVNATSSFEDFVRNNMVRLPPKLPDGMDYVPYAGKDNAKRSNFENSRNYIAAKGNAGSIGDSPWGKFIQDPVNDQSYKVMGDKFRTFMNSEGFAPMKNDYVGALKDVMWNAGSEPFMSNAIKTGRPIRGFVENATPNRGFTNFELTTALKSPDTVFNGYPMRAFTGDPVAFASKSATEFQQLEAHLAKSASANSNRPVNVADIRANVDVIGGYDAVNKKVFSQSIDDLSKLTLDQMTAASRSWIQVRVSTQAAVRTNEAEPTRTPAESPPHTGPPKPTTAVRTAAQGEAETALRSRSAVSASSLISEAPAVRSAATEGLGPGLGRVAGKVAVVATVTYEGITTTERVIDLRNQGNIVGAQSEILHFAGRNVGMLGGAALGTEAGAAVGWETGPGAFVSMAAGGVVGAIAGEKSIEAVDNERIYTQADPNDQRWHFDPQQPAQGWTRTVTTLAPDAARLNEGFPVYRQQTFSADAALSHQLNYQASNVAVQLALKHPPTPQDPYSIAPSRGDTPSIRDSNWTRDAQTHGWSRTVTTAVMEHGMVNAHTETAKPPKTVELNRASDAVIAQNIANAPRAIAARYQAAYEQYGWNRFGPPEAAVTSALDAPTNTLQASDGHEYTRGTDGEWTTPGRVYGTNAAEGNLRAELDATGHQQRALHGESSHMDRVQEAQRQQETQGHLPARDAPVSAAAAVRAPAHEAATARHVPSPAQPRPETHHAPAPAHPPAAGTAKPDHAALAAQQVHQQAMHAQWQAQRERTHEEHAAAPAHSSVSPEPHAVAAAAALASAVAPSLREVSPTAHKPRAPAAHAAPQATAPLSPPLDPPAMRDFRHADQPLHGRYQLFRDALGEQGFHEARPTLNDVAAVRGYSTEQKDRLAAGFTAKLGTDLQYNQEIQHFRKAGDALLAIEHPEHLGDRPLILEVPEAQTLARTPEQHAAAWRARELPQPQSVNTQRLDPHDLSPENPGHPDHPRHPMFEHARAALTTEYARWGIQKGSEQLDRESVQVMIAARGKQLNDVGAIRLMPNHHEGRLGEHPGLAVFNRPEGPRQDPVAVPVVQSQALQQAPPVAQAAAQFQAVDQQVTQQVQMNQQLQAQINAQGQQGPMMAGLH